VNNLEPVKKTFESTRRAIANRSSKKQFNPPIFFLLQPIVTGEACFNPQLKLKFSSKNLRKIHLRKPLFHPNFFMQLSYFSPSFTRHTYFSHFKVNKYCTPNLYLTLIWRHVFLEGIAEKRLNFLAFSGG
jgi:hypothetical protein